VSDVPVGVFLSGGIDSRTNAALFSEDEKDSVKTFSVGFEGNHDSYRNEFDYARLMASHVAAGGPKVETTARPALERRSPSPRRSPQNSDKSGGAHALNTRYGLVRSSSTRRPR
jgi:hypothetical protein